MKVGPKMISAISRKKSLTFIELLIVVIIIGILIGVSLPNLTKTFNNLQLNNFSRELQTFMNYLHERSIVEEKIIYLKVDNEKKKYWAETQREAEQTRLKGYTIPEALTIEVETESQEFPQNQIRFFPDGSIDKVTIDVVNQDSQKMTLTTKGVFGGVKLLPKE